MLVDFQFAQRGDALELSCTAPRSSVDGVAFENVDIDIFWGEGEIDLEKEGHRHSVRALAGQRVVATLPLPGPGTLVRAAARAEVGGNQGQRTLILALEAQAPLTPPLELAAQLLGEGVSLSWQGPLPEPVEPPDLGPAGGAPVPFSDFFSRERPTSETTPRGESPEGEREAEASDDPESEVPGQPGEASGTVDEDEAPEELLRTHGFLVYRRRQSDETYGVPLDREPQEARELLDRYARVGATACYVVRAAGSVNPLIESGPSNEVCLAVRDITPPSPPTGLAVVPRDGGLEVVWSPSPAPDLGGYRIYRATGEGEPEAVAEVEATETAWHDRSVEGGVLYRYEIAALDRAGNEGPPSGTAEGRPE
jgi:hypothetical protein